MAYIDRKTEQELPVQKEKKGKCRILIALAAAAAVAAFAGIMLCCRRKKAQPQKETNEVWKTYVMPEGTAIAYEKQGGGDLPVVLLHGLYAGADRKEWANVAKSMAEKDEGYTVYTLDLPGFGQSSVLRKPWSAYHYVKAIHSFLKNVVQKPAVIIGVGISADFALMISRLYKEDVKKLVLLSPEGIGKGFANKEDVRFLKMLLCPVLGIPAFLFGTRKKAVTEELYAMFYEKERIPADFLGRVKENARKGKGARVRYAQCKTRFAACDTKHAFQELSLPFLCIWGEKNKKNPPIYLEEAEKLQEKGEFMLFEDTAELPHLENPKSFLQIMEGFL